MPGKRSFAQMLPENLHRELNQKLRDADYGQHEPVAGWLAAKGVKTSRSAVHRYSMALKQADGAEGTAGSLKLAAEKEATIIFNSDLHSLYMRLGELEFEKSQILATIQALTEQEDQTEL